MIQWAKTFTVVVDKFYSMSMLIKAQHANLRTVAININTKYIQYVGQTITITLGDRHGLNMSLWLVASMMPKNAAKRRCTCMYIYQQLQNRVKFYE